MNSYVIFGLTIHSDFPLPSLQRGGADADVVIHKGDYTPPELNKGKFGLSYLVTPDTVYLRWDRVADFRMHEGRDITVIPVPGVSNEVLQGFIIGSALGSTLHQRGYFSLHASAISDEKYCFAFIGESGYGKSTLAAHLHTRGYQMISDDIVAVQLAEEGYLVYPGVPEFKLWPDSLAAMGKDFESLPEVFPNQIKRINRVNNGIQTQPTILKHIYVLDRGERNEIIPLTPATAMMELVRHTYGVEIFHQIAPGSRFVQCSTLARDVPVKRLCRTMTSLDQLPELMNLIEDDIHHGV